MKKTMTSPSKKCNTPYCRNKTKRGKKCQTCYARKWRAKHPIKYAFYTLRSNARRRGKDFQLSFADFEKFVTENDYMRLKGTTRVSLTIDRINNAKGYHKDNIQAITLSENSIKSDASIRMAYARGWIQPH